MAPLRVALIGYGYWGPNLARNVSEHPGARLVAVCDQNPAPRARAAAKHPSARLLSDARDVFRSPDVDAVIVATSASTHAPLVREALRAGKHVLVEKPLAGTVREAESLAGLAEKKRLTLLVGHTFLYSPPVRRVKALLDRKALGRLYTMDFSRVNLGLFQPDVNVLWDLAPHDLSIALYWAGRGPRTVRASAKSFVRKGIEEVGHLALEFPDGLWIHQHLSWLAPVKLRRVTVVGSKKMLVYDDTQNMEKLKIYNHGVLRNPGSFGEFQLTYRSGDVASPSVAPTEPLSLEMEDFVRCARTGKRPVSDGRFGVEVVKILAAAQKSLERGGTATPVR